MGLNHATKYSLEKVKHDEYYTTKEEAEYIIRDFIGYNYFKDKIVYCPCDSEESEFTIYFNEHGGELKYKEFIHTSDDFNTHADLFEYADIIITNPPFSKINKEFFPIIRKHANKFFYFHSISSILGYAQHNDIKIFRAPFTKFITPIKHDTTNEKFQFIQHIYVTNIEHCDCLANPKSLPNKTFEELYKDKEPVWGVYDDDDVVKKLVIDKIKEIPIDYKEPMLVPLTIALYPFRKYFNFINTGRNYTKNSDGRSRYMRFLIEWK